MANVKITALPLLTPAATDVLPVVDVSADITKKATVEDISKNAGNGTAAVPSHSFASDSDTGLFRAGANRLAFSTGGAQRAEINSSGSLLVNTLNTTSTTTSGASLDAVGKITLQRADSSNNTDRIVKAYKGSTETFAIQADGTVLIGGNLTNSTNPSPNIKLNADGGAKFSNITIASNGNYFTSANVFAGQNPVLGIASGSGLANGKVMGTNTGSANIWEGRDTATGSAITSFIRANGSARFKGSVSIGGNDAAHTIDEYEEGVFTPSVEFGGSSTGVAYSSRLGTYTRIGDQVRVYVYINLSNKGSDTGNAVIKTLPFTAANFSATGLVGWPGVIVARQQNFNNLDSNNSNVSATALKNGLGISLRSAAGVDLNNNNFTNGTVLEFQLSYTTS